MIIKFIKKTIMQMLNLDSEIKFDIFHEFNKSKFVE